MSTAPIKIEDASRAAALLGTSFLVAGGGLGPSLATVTGGMGPALTTVTGGFLLLIAEQDLRELRISNRLTGPALAAALFHASWVAGSSGLLAALAGAAVGLAILFPLFLLRWWGAGDVKAVMVLGAVFGASAIPGLVTWAVLAGGLISALAWLADRGDLRSSAPGIPFAPALVLAVAAFQLWGNPWNI